MKYIILVLVNLPLIITGIVGAIIDYKAKPRIISKKKCIELFTMWLFIGIALILVEPAYNTLIAHNLTNSPPMTIFDVVLLTVIIYCLLLITKINERISVLNKKLARVHEKLAIVETEQDRARH